MERIVFDSRLMAEDMAAAGWLAKDLASRVRPRVAVSTVTRFLRGESQTAPMAKRLARALGYDVRRYLAQPNREVA
jgi:hypothetical protein